MLRLRRILPALVGVFLLGCARNHAVILETSPEARTYEILGSAEVFVKVSSNLTSKSDAASRASKRAAHLQTMLEKKLLIQAKELFKADAIHNVKFWPPLDSLSFPEKKVYARGEFIRYKKFPEDS